MIGCIIWVHGEIVWVPSVQCPCPVSHSMLGPCNLRRISAVPYARQSCGVTLSLALGREREQARAASRAKEAEEDARLREVGAGASELRAKQRPVRSRCGCARLLWHSPSAAARPWALPPTRSSCTHVAHKNIGRA